MKSRTVKKAITVEELQKTVEDLLTKDGFLVPVIFVCGKNEASILDVSTAIRDDEGKDALVDSLVEFISSKKAYKVIMVSECWAYKAPDKMTREEIDEVIKLGTHRHAFEKEEMYQIVEIMSDKIAMLTRAFHREENGKAVLTGDTIKSAEIELVRFKPIQEALGTIN
jgi:hypothetical protein